MSVEIIHLGLSGFPFQKTAPITRIRYICKSIVEAGLPVTIICKKPIQRYIKYNHQSSKVNDNFEGINYIYLSSSNHFTFINKLIDKIRSIFFEIKEIKRIKKRADSFLAIYYPTGSFLELLYYRIISILIGFPVISNYVEYRSQIPSRSSIFKKINDILFDTLINSLVDGFLPISDYIEKKIEKNKFSKPYLKIPPLADYNINTQEQNKKKYFVFCGNVNYYEVIIFIINSFYISYNKDYKLHLVLNGPENKRKQIEQILKDKDFDFELHYQLTDNELLELYKNASGLLVPLRNTIQDIARFPQKIAEYLVSGTPIITTNYGEIERYFKDEKNALIAKDYSIKNYRNKINFVVENPDLSNNIGFNGFKIGKKLFHYQNYSKTLSTFINNILN